MKLASIADDFLERANRTSSIQRLERGELCRILWTHAQRLLQQPPPPTPPPTPTNNLPPNRPFILPHRRRPPATDLVRLRATVATKAALVVPTVVPPATEPATAMEPDAAATCTAAPAAAAPTAPTAPTAGKPTATATTHTAAPPVFIAPVTAEPTAPTAEAADANADADERADATVERTVELEPALPVRSAAEKARIYVLTLQGVSTHGRDNWSKICSEGQFGVHPDPTTAELKSAFEAGQQTFHNRATAAPAARRSNPKLPPPPPPKRVCQSEDSDSDSDGSCSESGSSQEYLVETLLAKRVENDETQYLVQWKGYSDSHNSWEPVRGIERSLIDSYELATRQRHRSRTVKH